MNEELRDAGSLLGDMHEVSKGVHDSDSGNLFWVNSCLKIPSSCGRTEYNPQTLWKYSVFRISDWLRPIWDANNTTEFRTSHNMWFLVRPRNTTRCNIEIPSLF